MVIKFLKVVLHNFKSHRDLTVNFGELTQITGDNAKGKTSIIEAVPYVLYGVDLLGSKFDPSPDNYDYDYVRAEFHFSVDGKEILLGRGVEGGKAVYYINEVPSKATEFDELVKSLFEKDEFLTLFNPNYFFSLKWTEQRALFMKYVPTPAKSEVLAEMSRTNPDQKAKDIKLNPQAAKLDELTKKHSLEQLDGIHRKNKKDKDDAHKRAQGKVSTLQGQLQGIEQVKIDLDAEEEKLAALNDRIANLEAGKDNESVRKIDQLQAKFDSLKQQVKSARSNYVTTKGEEVGGTCNKCGQALQGEVLQRAIASHNGWLKRLANEANRLIEEARSVKEELTTAKENYKEPDSEANTGLQGLIEQKAAIEEAIRQHKARKSLQDQLEKAKAEEDTALKSRNDSIFVLDAIKAYDAKAAEIQASKVQDLFTTLSLRLFKVNKTDGEIKPDFEIEKDDKPYRKLSRSEKVHAGLELQEVLSKLSDIVAPCAVDDCESVFRIKKTSGQLILVKAVEDEPLKIETGGNQS